MAPKVLESREKGRTPCVRIVAASHHVEHSHDVTASLRSVAAIVGRKLSLKGSCQSKHSLGRSEAATTRTQGVRLFSRASRTFAAMRVSAHLEEAAPARRKKECLN